jgi:hypothetical protein
MEGAERCLPAGVEEKPLRREAIGGKFAAP